MPYSEQILNLNSVHVVRRGRAFWFHLGFVLLFGIATVAAPVLIFRAQSPYINLDSITFIVSLGTLLTLMFAWVIVGRTASIQLLANSFVVRKRWQRATEYPYSAITGHNVRETVDRHDTWTELTLYLPDNWVALRSIDFLDFDELVAHFSAISPAVPYRPVLSLAEQRLARWFLFFTFLTAIGPIWFGFAAYQPVDKQPAALMPLSGQLTEIRATNNRGRFTGVAFRLAGYPAFRFHARKGIFSDSLRAVPYWLAQQRQVTLTIREHDFLAKISRQEPLTFADTYDDYAHIPVFGITDQHAVHLHATQPVYGDTHTQPYVRLFIFVAYVLILWSCGVAVSNRTI